MRPFRRATLAAVIVGLGWRPSRGLSRGCGFGPGSSLGHDIGPVAVILWVGKTALFERI